MTTILTTLLIVALIIAIFFDWIRIYQYIQYNKALQKSNGYVTQQFKEIKEQINSCRELVSRQGRTNINYQNHMEKQIKEIQKQLVNISVNQYKAQKKK